MMDKKILELVSFAYQKQLIKREDIVYVINRLCEKLRLDDFNEPIILISDEINHVEVLNCMVDYAYNEGIISSNKAPFSDLFDTAIMDILMPMPSTVIDMFYKKYEESPKLATEYYYDLSKNSNYIRMDRVKKNLQWKVNTDYGDIDISVNLSKPEKDPKMIALMGKQKETGYPKCLLCYENVGYKGSINKPARHNHRIIPVKLANEEWYFQYSPYVYFNEHSIVFNKKHTPMKINSKTFERLFDFIDLFPHYFIGSNADLPIVGGSMLAHDHYQSGMTEFPIERVNSIKSYKINKYKDVSVNWINWPLTVLRLNSKNRESLIACANLIADKWKVYTDESAGVIAKTDEIHNTVTPIARKRGENYELDIVLRNNRVSEEYPDGIFHPHKHVHSVKKENIGLIEVMGLAILPSRLKLQMNLLSEALQNGVDINGLLKDDEIALFKDIYSDMLIEYKNTHDAINSVKKVVGLTFVKGLECCGVFKLNDTGKQSMDIFMGGLNV